MAEQGQHIERIKQILLHSFDKGKALLKKMHPSEIARVLEDLSPETREKVISLLPAETAGETLAEMDETSRPEDILSSLSPEKAAEIIEQLDPDDAADLLAQLPTRELRKIMEKLGESHERVITELLTYPEETAGGIMNPEVLKIPENSNKMQALEEVVKFSEENEDFFAIYVVDKDGRLVGIMPLKELIKGRPSASIADLMNREVVRVHVMEDQEQVAKIMSQYNLPALPVVDENEKLLGRITFDDVLDIMEKESTEDMLKIAGVSEEEELRGTWLNAIRSRLPWLVMNLITAFFAGLVISWFHGTIEKMVIITSYMPIIAGVAGNGATQTLAVTIRRLATDNLPPSDFLKVIIKELGVGLANGIVVGGIITAVSFSLGQNPMLGLVIFLAMTMNMVVAGVAGSAVPLLLERLRVDPAVASSIFITAFTDILGFTLLLGLTSMLLL